MRDAKADLDDLDRALHPETLETEAGARGGDRFAAGATPLALADADQVAADDREVELKAKVKALVDKSFGGDYQVAFDHYAGADHRIEKDELIQMLEDADFGNWAIRGIAAGKIIAKLDTSGDKKIAWAEFEYAMKG